MIRVVIFGNGFGRHVVLPCLRHVDKLEVVGIASPTLSRVQETAEQFEIPLAVADHRELLDQASADLAIVTTPPHRHLDQTLDALAAGCHVICEKPTALDQSESGAMLAAAQKHADRITLIDHELRLDPRRLQLQKWVREGRLGELQHATYTLRSPSLRGERPFGWWFDEACGGGALGALGSHAIDSLRSVCGEITAVNGQLATFQEQRQDGDGAVRDVTVDEFTNAWLRFESGAIGTLHISMIEGARQHSFAVAGTEGCASVEEQGALCAGWGSDPISPVEVEDDLPPNQELEIPDTDWARNFVRLARATAAAIRAGHTDVAGAADFADGHRNQQVLDAIRRSNTSGTWVTVGT